jgi:hypothetical protein
VDRNIALNHNHFSAERSKEVNNNGNSPITFLNYLTMHVGVFVLPPSKNGNLTNVLVHIWRWEEAYTQFEISN